MGHQDDPVAAEMRAQARRMLAQMRGEDPEAAEARHLAWVARRRKDFYSSRQWKALRYEVLVERGARCECCGRSPPEVTIDVDHVKSRSKYPELQLVKSNMQILCRCCNFSKSNRDETDWRAR
jgi:5-methylcytosine-specific restriction endonuclease McrA